MMCSVVFCFAVFLNVLRWCLSHCTVTCRPARSPVTLCRHLSPWAVVLQAEKVLLFSQDTNLTALLLEAKDLEARVIILSARFV